MMIVLAEKKPSDSSTVVVRTRKIQVSKNGLEGRKKKEKGKHLLRESILDRTVGIVPRNPFPAKCSDPI